MGVWPQTERVGAFFCKEYFHFLQKKHLTFDKRCVSLQYQNQMIHVMKATSKDYKETIHTIQRVVEQLVAMGLPQDKAEVAARLCNRVASASAMDTQRMMTVDTDDIFNA